MSNKNTTTSKKPNFVIAATTNANTVTPTDNSPAQAPLFDGFKTGHNPKPTKKPFDFRSGKPSSNTDYAGNSMGIGALERNIVKDIHALDSQLVQAQIGTVSSQGEGGLQSKQKPKLFSKPSTTIAAPSNSEKQLIQPSGQKKIAVVQKADWSDSAAPAQGVRKKNLNSEPGVEGRVVGTKNTQANMNMEIEANEAQFERLFECEDCGRKFRKETFDKHTKVCKSVFQKREPRQRGNSYAPNRTEEPANGDSNKGGADKQQWKKNSDNFRKMLRGENMTTEAELLNAPELPQVVCDVCGKSFNEGALARHRPLCDSKKRWLAGAR